MLAIRLARVATGRSKIVRIAGHFHGWHDHLSAAYVNHFDGSAPVGVTDAVAADVLVIPPNDREALQRVLEARDDIAALILEPTGGSFGRVPADPAWVAEVRERTAARGVVLIFDEVITGFRCARGGAQQALGIRPDLATVAKVLAGGLPGGAVIGRKDIMDALDAAASRAAGREKVLHFGTYNANPVSAAAGIAALEVIATTSACEDANAAAGRLRDALNQVIAHKRVPWAVFGTYSGFQIFTNPKRRPIPPGSFDPLAVPYDELRTNDARIVNLLRLAMLLEGVDINGWPGGNLSATHGDAELGHTAEAFDRALQGLQAEGVFG